ncbi:OsmC family protein [Rhodotorula toruloides ATCC 204091]|uniref:OsmC family protein n=1 Tax=Rhodotorula toruloides TaxID=5286 RepID=A0A0K3CGA0_RHOTO|nr:OsmC family protein [Rhodotorula toruloides ATCC 204091]KAK4334934.1 OsmC family protein [Rhodotorula toruloides]PRQ76330.1 OsmC family protein [Rhodotorula toruloides]
MDAATLRAQQAPLKEQYQSNPSSARVTLSSSSTLEEGDGAACSLSVGKALKKAGLHAMAGGTDAEQLCSGDMLLEALVACTGVSLKAVATSLEIPVKSGKITAEGDLDFRGTLGVDKSVPVGFLAIRLKFDLDCPDVPKEKINLLIKLTERYCVVLQTLKNAIPCESTVV